MDVRKEIVFVSLLLCISIICSGCGKAKEEPKEMAPVEMKMLLDRGDLTPEQIARELELAPNKEYEDFIDLGTAYLWLGEYYKAAEAYEMAARRADNIPHLSGALFNKAVSLGYAGYIQEALNTIDLMVELQPENIEIAWLRHAFYRYAGDSLGLKVSGDHLITLDPSLSGDEVILPETVILIVVPLVVAAASATTITAIYLTPPDDRIDVVPKVMEAYFRVMSPIAPSAIGFGQYLLQQISENVK